MSALPLALLTIGLIITGYLLGRKIKNKWLFGLSQIVSIYLVFNLLAVIGIVMKIDLREMEKAGYLLVLIGIPLFIVIVATVKVLSHKKHVKF